MISIVSPSAAAVKPVVIPFQTRRHPRAEIDPVLKASGDIARSFRGAWCTSRHENTARSVRTPELKRAFN